jgi:hypothetical protein
LTVFLNIVPVRKSLACSVPIPPRMIRSSRGTAWRLVKVVLPGSVTASQPRWAGPTNDSPKNSPQVI